MKCQIFIISLKKFVSVSDFEMKVKFIYISQNLSLAQTQTRPKTEWYHLCTTYIKVTWSLEKWPSFYLVFFSKKKKCNWLCKRQTESLETRFCFGWAKLLLSNSRNLSKPMGFDGIHDQSICDNPCFKSKFRKWICHEICFWKNVHHFVS